MTEWQTIDSAPHSDGWIKRCLLGALIDGRWSAWVGQRDDWDMWLGVDETGACWECLPPTHWMPLPEPPK